MAKQKVTRYQGPGRGTTRFFPTKYYGNRTGGNDKSGGSSNYGNSRPATTLGNFLERAQSRQGTRVPATRNDNTFGNSRSEYGASTKSPTVFKG